MSSYYRGHHGRPRPPPAQNRPGHQSSSAPPPTTVDPHYLAYLQSQAAQIDSQISALSGRHQVTPSPTAQVPFPQGPPSRHYQLPSTSRRPKRNPSREGSKWRFYAVKNGLEGNDVYSSWDQAYPYCWNPATQYFYPGSFCKGFDNYNTAWNFLLGIHSPDATQTNPLDSIPSEPPEFEVPPEPCSVPIPSEVSSSSSDSRQGTYQCRTLLPPTQIQHQSRMSHLFSLPLQTKRSQSIQENPLKISASLSTN